MTVKSEQERKYRVANLYDMDYLLDENQVVVLQANRAPSIADMEAVAKRFNSQLELLAAAKAALMVLYQTKNPDDVVMGAITDLESAINTQDKD